MSHAAMAVLCTGGSEAAVERTFSAQGLVHTDRRNRMGDDVVAAEMFLKFNQPTMDRLEQRTRKKERTRSLEADLGCVEIGEDYDAGSELSLAGLFKRPERRLADAAAGAAQVVDNDEDAKDEAEPVDLIPARAVPSVQAVRRAPATDDVQRFIEFYVQSNRITASYRWTAVKLQILEAAGGGFDPPMRDAPDELRKKIMAWVRGSRLQQDDAEDAADQ